MADFTSIARRMELAVARDHCCPACGDDLNVWDDVEGHKSEPATDLFCNSCPCEVQVKYVRGGPSNKRDGGHPQSRAALFQKIRSKGRRNLWIAYGTTRKVEWARFDECIMLDAGFRYRDRKRKRTPQYRAAIMVPAVADCNGPSLFLVGPYKRKA